MSFSSVKRWLIVGLLTLSGGAVAQAAPPDSTASAAWVYPVIAGHGGVHPRPDAAVRPDPKADYKLLVDVVHGPHATGKVPRSLERLARLVNLMTYAGVPASHVHIVAILDDQAAFSAMTDATWQARHKGHNPSLALLHSLRQAGVKLLVCSQALAKMKLADSNVSPDVTVTLSALTDMAVYGQRGYVTMQL
ncbi:DsrE family protein [Oleiagrimonas sp. C23AA]|uniref:DsrE family protein n=1 Tax=Oleiagrimonas sp. C23AA TaxID=2719047 RepID=UPI0014226214|nr:DsrE family protein [Oleiagrimonas sp. C23AA]NII09714.1 DsrE family protein [Oleiagrimonas sp. C23AA]